MRAKQRAKGELEKRAERRQMIRGHQGHLKRAREGTTRDQWGKI